MRPFRLLPVALVAALSCAPAPEPKPAPPPAPAPAADAVPEYSAIERRLMHGVNVERMRNHLDTLRWNAALDKAAKVQAVQMAAERKMAHELPHAQYPTLQDRIRYAGYNYRHMAENVAYGYPTPEEAIAAWMTSTGHRANILDRASRETGVGVARAKTGELYYCQVFGSRLFDLP